VLTAESSHLPRRVVRTIDLRADIGSRVVPRSLRGSESFLQAIRLAMLMAESGHLPKRVGRIFGLHTGIGNGITPRRRDGHLIRLPLRRRGRIASGSLDRHGCLNRFLGGFSSRLLEGRLRWCVSRLLRVQLSVSRPLGLGRFLGDRDGDRFLGRVCRPGRVVPLNVRQRAKGRLVGLRRRERASCCFASVIGLEIKLGEAVLRRRGVAFRYAIDCDRNATIDHAIDG
jgi:hypothetical protein